jgi:hypothetical protein
MSRSVEDLDQASQVLYSAFQEVGLTRENSAGRLWNQFHLLDTTYVVIIRLKGEIIGTFTVINQNPYGLPAGVIADISPLQSKGPVAEIGSFAVAPEYRRLSAQIWLRVAIFCFRFIFFVSKHRYIVVRAAHEHAEYYEGIFGWQRYVPAPVRDWQSNGAERILVYVGWPDFEPFFTGKKAVFLGEPVTLRDLFCTLDIPGLAIPSVISRLPPAPREYIERTLKHARPDLYEYAVHAGMLARATSAPNDPPDASERR